MTVDALLAAALDELAVGDHPEPLASYGTRAAYRVGPWLVKTAADGNAQLHHEAQVYAIRQQQGLHPGARHGHAGDGLWLAVPWIPGATLWDTFAPARAGRDDQGSRDTILTATQGAFAELSRWHAAKWLHGDIQPANIVIGAAVELIDYDYARHPELPLPFPYRGGMEHPTAPEIARQLIETPDDVDVHLDQAAEVYALGASIRWAWTGRPPPRTATQQRRSPSCSPTSRTSGGETSPKTGRTRSPSLST